MAVWTRCVSYLYHSEGRGEVCCIDWKREVSPLVRQRVLSVCWVENDVEIHYIDRNRSFPSLIMCLFCWFSAAGLIVYNMFVISCLLHRRGTVVTVFTQWCCQTKLFFCTLLMTTVLLIEFECCTFPLFINDIHSCD